MLDRVSAEPTTSRSGEQDSCAIISTLLPDPRCQHDDSGFGQWSTSFLTPLPFASNMRSLTKADILSSNRGDLGETEAGLNRGQEEPHDCGDPTIYFGLEPSGVHRSQTG